MAASTICAVYAHNDDMMIGAIQAMKEAGLQPGSQILTVSVESVPDMFKAMMAHEANATVELTPDMAAPAFQCADRLQEQGHRPAQMDRDELGIAHLVRRQSPADLRSEKGSRLLMDVSAHVATSRGVVGPGEDALLVVRGLCKSFGAVSVLQDVDLVLRAGEIHALLGENGAGKSTLIKLVTGVHQRDAGNRHSRGRADRTAFGERRTPQAASPRSTRRSISCRTCRWPQNLFLGRQPTRLGIVREGAMRRPRIRNAA